MAEGAGKILPVDLTDEMRRSYIDYAMSVIVARALPDARDGLKPVHRRVLYAMYEAGNTPDKPYKKSARIVGDVLGRYHPHGDMAVYDAAVRLAQDFSTRMPLIDGHGNFGSVDGDPPAAMRYCVAGDTLVVTDQGLVRIDEMSQGQGAEIEARVLSAMGRVHTASRWFDSGVLPTRRVRTRCGFEVTGTTNHPLLTLVEGPDGKPELSWKLIEDLRLGDWLVLDRASQLWPSEEVELAGYWPTWPAWSRVQQHSLPQRLDEKLALLLGAVTAGGTVRAQGLEFTNVNGEFATRFQETWADVFPSCRLHVSERQAVGYGRQPLLQMQVVSQHAGGFLRNVGLHGMSAERRVPAVVMRSPRQVVASFLRGLYEGDGAVEQSGRSLLRIAMSSASLELLRQVQILLLRFGIVSTVNSERTREGRHRLLIVGEENLKRFSEQIGFVSLTKRAALQRALSTYSGRVLSQTDFFPYLGSYVRRHARRGQREWLGKHDFDRTDRLAAALPHLRKAVPEAMAAGLEQLIEANYLYEPIVAVEDAGEQPVYSIRVDSTCHSFVANGFVNHNTEVRLTKIALELLRDIDKETVNFRPNFSEEFEEPIVLPSRFPNLLVNGSSGIAVGMATNIPPHNLGEVIDGTIHLIDHPEATSRDLMQFVHGPDFPTAALILGHRGIQDMYETGRGAIMQRAVTDIEVHQGKARIVVTELPYQVNKARLVERIAELVREKKIEGITDLRDESDRTGMRIVIEVRRDQNPKVLLNQLYKHTALQQSFGAIMLALVDNQPRILRLRDILEVYVRHQREVVTRRSQFELRKAEERAHILEGLRIALDHLDAVIALIRAARDAETARSGLMEKFGLSERQAQAILDLRLQRLTQLERKKIDDEYDELQTQISYLRALLGSDQMLRDVIKHELAEIRQRFANDRRTQIVQETGDLQDEDLIADEACVVTLTHQNYIKRQHVDVYRAQHRGGRGITGTGTKAEDFVERIFATRTHHWLLFFTDRGRVYRIKVHGVPEAGRTARGTAAVNLVNLASDEQITATITLQGEQDEGFLFMITRFGTVKKTPIEEYASIRSNGLIAIGLDEQDSLIGVHHTSGEEEVVLVTHQGMAIRFSEQDVRSMGRQARGVRGIRLGPDDYVVGTAVTAQGSDLVVATNRGMGKRTAFGQFRAIGRGGKGVRAISLTHRNGYVAAVRSVNDPDHLMLVSAQGIIIRLNVAELPRYSRASQGVQLMRLDPEDELVAMARLSAEEEQLLDEGDSD